MKRCVYLFAVILLVPQTALALQQDENPAPVAVAQTPPGVSPKTVQEIVEIAQASIVTIRFTGREGQQQGMGAGFVIDADGLIATNMHVIGEARPITVELADGRKFDVVSVHASDRDLDLAVVKIDAKGLKPLELGDSEALRQGEAVVAIGNPLGLVRSVVSGLLSAKREAEPKLQLSMPIVPGNSGGPVLDLQGKVQGVVSQRSLREANVGYAVTVNSLKPLLAKPNPIAMSNWLTIGALDASEWLPLFGARWRQRAGRIQVEGLGSGFGGRSLCLWQQPVPEVPFEISVAVRLDDESGAAGLVFHSDGDQRHYGFYPSAGKLRLSRFDGPDVFAWNILSEVESSHYQPEEWNTLKVRVEKDRMLCYVNGQLAIESADAALTSGKVGLAKFRNTTAQFKQFRVAKELPADRLSDELIASIQKEIDVELQHEPPAELIARLTANADAAGQVLENQARQWELQAQRLRTLARTVHEAKTRKELLAALEPEDGQSSPDLLRAALLLARLDNPELEVEAYLDEVAKMAREIENSLPENATEANRLEALNHFLFKKNGFHGSRTNYYSRANSYLNEVIDDREGLPITLSVLYMELARRIGIRVVGVPLPGHFIVRFEPKEGEELLIDVFDGGKTLRHNEAEAMILGNTGRPAEEGDFEATTPNAIIKRMLFNLLHVAEAERDRDAMLRYLDVLVAVAPDSGPERWMRAVLRMNANLRNGAREDADWLLEHAPEGVDIDRVHQFRQLLQQ